VRWSLRGGNETPRFLPCWLRNNRVVDRSPSAGCGANLCLGGLSASPREAPYYVAMFENLRRLGFIEGQNLTIDWHAFALHADRLSDFAAELVKADVDVILASGNLATRAAQRATQSIPILGTSDDMVRSGLVKSLARPEGNTTGISMFSTELDGKRQEILIEAVPGLHRMASRASSSGEPSSSMSFSRNAASYFPRPRLRSQTTMSMTVAPQSWWRTSSAGEARVSRVALGFSGLRRARRGLMAMAGL
jgi:hypothetical protein